MSGITDVLDLVDNDRPDPPIHLSSEAAYGWECGWGAAVQAVRDELDRLRAWFAAPCPDDELFRQEYPTT